MSVGLLLSILIRLVALGWSLLLLHRLRDWRMGFLSVMLGLMALRQTLTLTSKSNSWVLNLSSLDTEWPGLVVSVMAFLSVYFVGRMLDERKKTANDQSELIKELEDKNAELERFSYTISHDLKTPLVTINGFLGYMQRDIEAGNTAGLKRDIKKISSAATSMAQLLDELLELARVGRAVNPFELIAVAKLIDDALKQVDVQLQNRQVTVNVKPDLPSVYADRDRLQEVFVILLDNAIKFAGNQSDQKIEIGYQNSGSEHVFQVSDNGIGIDPKYLEYVFGLFDRLDHDTEGTGVGLALAKRIIELHRGRIWAESEGNGRGCSIRFSMPI